MKVIDFDVYKNLLHQKSGQAITTDKSYLLESRLAHVIKKWDIDSTEELTQILRGKADPKLIEDVITAMATNETTFFRDQKPFDAFRDMVVPAIIAAKGPACTIRIWSAGCSSGQEPYTLAITIKENTVKWPNVKFEIVATDLSRAILTQAQTGRYSQFEVQHGMPITLLLKYFTQSGDNWTVKDDIKNMVTFQYFNLLDDMDSLGTFDMIFCRNVLSYFTQDTKAGIFDKFSRRILKSGYLFLGSSETVLGVTQAFKPFEGERGLYIPA